MKIVKWIFCILFCMVVCCGCTKDSLQYVKEVNTDDKTDSYGAKEDVPTEDVPTEDEMRDTVTVHICGEVYFPGVYTVYSGSRVHEVIKLAGGFTENADAQKINQAKEVFDGEQICIPEYGVGAEEIDEGLVNINTADIERLCTIPGIGEARAKQIIDYRIKNGNFNKIEDIMNISGIKEGMYEKIAPYITVS